MSKAMDTQEIIGTMNGHRGIQFVFTLKTGSKVTVTFDFYANGQQFNGAPYAKIEAAACAAVSRAGHDVDTFTHFLIS